MQYKQRENNMAWLNGGETDMTAEDFFTKEELKYPALKRLQINLKNYPWQHYLSYKVDKNEADELINELVDLFGE